MKRNYEKIYEEKNRKITNKIEMLMKKKGITKMELARALNKRPSEATRWLSGKHNFTLKTLAKLSSVLGDELFEFE